MHSQSFSRTDEFVVLDDLSEGLLVHKVVVHAVDLARSGLARGVARHQLTVVILLQVVLDH